MPTSETSKRQIIELSNARQIESARRISMKLDGLTQIRGSDAFLDALAGLRNRCQRFGHPLTVALIDLGRFNECNEQRLTALSGAVRRWFTGIVEEVAGAGYTTAHCRGGQFFIALPNAREAEAVELVDRCRSAWRSNPITIDGQALGTGIIAGIVESGLGCLETPHRLLRQAHIALGQAKRQGWNCTATWRQTIEGQEPREAQAVNEASWGLDRLRERLRCTYLESIQALVAAAEAKDPYARTHSLAVASYAEAIGRRIGIRGQVLDSLQSAALLHDVGKLAVPEAILTKPGPLTPGEFEIIKRHPRTALEILGHVSFLSAEKPLILHHHERYDGSGYPAGLAADRIPVGARILAVADALDTMLSPRTYKEPYSLDRVLDELRAGAGGQFDPAVIDTTLRWLEETPNAVTSLKCSITPRG